MGKKKAGLLQPFSDVLIITLINLAISHSTYEQRQWDHPTGHLRSK
jgi:hypothetical protein